MSRSQLVLRAVLCAASLTLLVLTLAGSPHPIVVAAFVLVALTGYVAVEPDSPWVLVLVGGHALHWVSAVPVPADTAAWMRLLAAATAGLVLHLSASLAASLPGPVPVPRLSLLRWTRRGAVVAAATVPVWAVAMLSGREAVKGEVSLTYAAIAAVAFLTFSVWLVSRDDRPRPEH